MAYYQFGHFQCLKNILWKPNLKIKIRVGYLLKTQNREHYIVNMLTFNFSLHSHAITTYLINKYAKDDSLYPSDARKRALVDQRLHFDTGVLFAALFATMVSGNIQNYYYNWWITPSKYFIKFVTSLSYYISSQFRTSRNTEKYFQALVLVILPVSACYM